MNGDGDSGLNHYQQRQSMKTRISLVSNSSSSSFILIGIPIDINLLNETHICQPTDKLHTVIVGKHLGEGRDIFGLYEEKQLRFIKDYITSFNTVYIKTKYLYEDSNQSLQELLDLYDEQDIKKLIITSGTADQNSSYNIKTMLYNYKDEIKDRVEKEVESSYLQE